MSFAGVIVYELGYDGETLRQHEFTGLTFDQVVAAPGEAIKLRYELSVADYPGKKELVEENRKLRMAVNDFWVYVNGAPILDYRDDE